MIKVKKVYEEGEKLLSHLIMADSGKRLESCGSAIV